jgi:sugar phosphate isomerase/epimerase
MGRVGRDAGNPSRGRAPPGSDPGSVIGVDSYAFHRLLGETRPGETPPLRPFARGSLDAVAECVALGVDAALLETVYLGDPTGFSPRAYLDEAHGLAIGLSWGAPDGFALGDCPAALDDLVTWLPHAAALGLPLMRIVAGGPAHRGRPIERVVALLREACGAARDHGVRLALENHGDLTAEQLERLLESVGDDDLRLCFDTANALRVGDDVAEAARRLAPRVEIVHLKDCVATWDDPAVGPVSVAPGEGVIPLEAVLASCAQALVCVELGQLAPDADERLLVGAYVEYLRAR